MVVMEEEMVNKKDFDEKVISGMKIGLMGLFVGVGDFIFWGMFWLVFVVLGVLFVLGGNIVGLLLFFILINVIWLSIKYYGLKYGYLKGIEILKDLVGNWI